MEKSQDIETIKSLLEKINSNTQTSFLFFKKKQNPHIIDILGNGYSFLLNQHNINTKPFVDMNSEFEALLKETNYKTEVKNDIKNLIKLLQKYHWDKPTQIDKNKTGIKILTQKDVGTRIVLPQEEKKLRELVRTLYKENCQGNEEEKQNEVNIQELLNNNDIIINSQPNDKLIDKDNLANFNHISPISNILPLLLFSPIRKCISCCFQGNKKHKSLKNVNKINKKLEKNI